MYTIETQKKKGQQKVRPQVGSKRNYGVDALRLFSMYLVMVLHVLGKGGILGTAQGAVSNISWLLETFAMCSVNCFGLISGYVGYTEEKKNYRFSKYISFWLQVVFYSLGLRLLYGLIHPELLTGRSLIEAALPVSSYHYWYVSAYTGLFFVIPWLNTMVRACSKRELEGLIAVIFLVFSVYANFARVFTDIFRLGGGYSFIWLIFLYLVGAWMKKCNISERISTKTCVLTIIVSVLLGWLTKELFPSSGSMFLTYLSPNILLIAIALMVLFSRARFSAFGQKLIHMFAPAAFGVYLLHAQKDFWEYFMAARFVKIADMNVLLFPFAVVLAAGGLFIFCLLVEKLRLILFKKCQINETAEKLAEALFEKIITYFK